MPDVDLSTLRGPELRHLLDLSRERGEATLAYRILQEMAARREGRAGRPVGLRRRSKTPNVVAIEPKELAEQDEEAIAPPRPVAARPARPSRRAAAKVAPPDPPAPAPKPRSVWDHEPEPPEESPLFALDQLWRDRMRMVAGLGRGFAGAGVGFVVGAIGVALVVKGLDLDRRAPAPPPAAAQIASVQPALAARPAAAVPLVVEAPSTPVPLNAIPDQAVAIPSATDAGVAAAAREAPPPTPAPQPETAPAAENPEAIAAQAPAETPATETPQPAPPARRADRCAAQPVPAERAICADPALRRLQRQLRDAYAQALAAHEDRALLRQRQLAWAKARDPVTDRRELAGLYERRIQKLKAATAAAQAEHAARR